MEYLLEGAAIVSPLQKSDNRLGPPHASAELPEHVIEHWAGFDETAPVAIALPQSGRN